MNETSTVLQAVIPVFAIAAVGLFIRKLNWLTEEADQSLVRVTVNLLMPCLILDSALGNPALAQFGNLLLAPALGIATVAVGIVLAYYARPLHGISDGRQRRTYAVAVGMHNYGYVPLPLALLLFDKQTAGVLFLHVVGVEVAMWTMGVLVISGSSSRFDWRKIINGPLIAIILALLLNALGWNSRVPTVVNTTMHWLGQCSIPMALILIGAIMADHLKEFHSSHGWRVIASSVLLRLAVLPLLFLLAARYLPTTLELKRVLVLEAAMPAAVFPIVLSKHYGGDPPTAMRVVLGTTVVGLITIPLWIRFGMKFVGL
jgi:malate permease and related proteins